MKQTRLYRPIGIKEMTLIIESGWKKFPPRLAWQPIFYPVMNQQYAEQIASEWNTGDEFSGYCGIVTCFELDAEYLNKYDVHNVGGHGHDELWIPAAALEEFNDHIIDGIRVVSAFFGEQFVMPKETIVADELIKFRQ